MPRQTRRSAPAQQQKRQAHTMPVRQAPPPAAPQQHHAPPPQQHHAPVPQQQHAMTPAPAPSAPVAAAQPQQPGLFAQMATTAAGVAVGSAVGHSVANGVSSLFGGSSDDKPAEQPQQQAAPQYQQAPPQYMYQQPQQQNIASCDADSKALMKCLEANNNDVSACQWYLDALKSCQQMASQY
ncbi:hypothetical protein LRAMOSA01888 [Lichtheimia ramosa]|uniref:CHCH domain-containing protein n=1 Tax=Lichtheimia ramosa TaxID=688394 RepID=A0A077WLE1_9FUNG|nr:hypothetical protein LRAMOSA01888 [Lichtheimia ramosa]